MSNIPNEIEEKGENVQSPSQTQNTQNTKPIQKKKWKYFLSIGLMLLIEVALPFILYYVLKSHMPEIWALIISGVPPFLVVVYGFIRKRRADIVGVMIIFSFIVTAIAATLKNDPKIYLLRESIITGLHGLAFLISLIPIKIGSFQMRPLMYYFSKDFETGGSFGDDLTEGETISERWDRYWNTYPVFRHGYIVLTAVWALGFIIEIPIRVIIILKTSSIDHAFILTNISSYALLGTILLFNIIYNIIFKKRCKKIIREDVIDSAAIREDVIASAAAADQYSEIK